MYSGIWSCVHKLSDSHGCHMMHATSAASHIGESGCVSAAARLRPCTIGPARRPAWIYHRTIPRISLSRNCKLSAPNQVVPDQILVGDLYLRKNRLLTHLCSFLHPSLRSCIFCFFHVRAVAVDRPSQKKMSASHPGTLAVPSTQGHRCIGTLTSTSTKCSPTSVRSWRSIQPTQSHFLSLVLVFLRYNL
jgi:hypothetical protein